MTDQRRFLYNSDYQTDMLIYVKDGSFTLLDGQDIGGIGTEDVDGRIAHNLPFTPLVEMVWSNTADFAICDQTNWDEDYFDTFWTTTTGQYYLCYSDDTNVVISGVNSSGSTKTLYYRIWGFAPSTADSTSVVPATANDADNYVLNTDYNYMKLAFSGSITPASGSVTFTHNLGYVPRVKIWAIASGLTYQVVDTTISFDSVDYGVYITDTQLIFKDMTIYDSLEYRIYYDS